MFASRSVRPPVLGKDVKESKDVKRSHMRASLAGQLVRFTSLAVFTSSLISGVLLAQQKPPVFRARTDLIQIDVTVLKDGKPVRGLKAEDFLLLEDNKPQKIEGFAEVDIPDAPRPPPCGNTPWRRMSRRTKTRANASSSSWWTTRWGWVRTEERCPISGRCAR